MKKRLLLTLSIFVASSCLAFADGQTGYVRTIKRPGKKVEYLENVQITVKGITGSFKSKKKGKFELELRPLNLKVGNAFALNSVFKSGYEIYDNNLSKVYSPGVPIEIVLKDIAQEAADQRKFADNMYKGALAQRDRKIKDLDSRLEQGKITEAKYREELQRFNDVFDKYQADINTIAKRYAGLDYENIDPVTEAINVAFSNGDFVLADSLLNTLGAIDKEIEANIKARADIDAKIDFGNAIVEEGNNERKQNLLDAERLAELAYAKHLSFLNNFQNDSAAYYLEKRAELLPDNIEYQLEAGDFLLEYVAQYQSALEYYNHSLPLAIKKYGNNHPDVATCYNNIAEVYATQGNFILALENYESSLKIRSAIFEEYHPKMSNIFNNIGGCYYRMGNYQNALENYEKALEIRLKNFGENHQAVATCYNNLGAVYDDMGDFSQALQYYEKALEIRLKIFGENHQAVAICYNNIGTLYSSQKDFSNGLYHFEKSFNIMLRVYGENHPQVARCYNNIGWVSCKLGNYQQALENYDNAQKIWLKILGEESHEVATILNNKGTVCFYQNDYTQALENFKKALKIQLRTFKENHPIVGRSFVNIGRVYESQGEYTHALENYERALEILSGIFGNDHKEVIIVKKYISIVKNKMTEIH